MHRLELLLGFGTGDGGFGGDDRVRGEVAGELRRCEGRCEVVESGLEVLARWCCVGRALLGILERFDDGSWFECRIDVHGLRFCSSLGSSSGGRLSSCLGRDRFLVDADAFPTKEGVVLTVDHATVVGATETWEPVGRTGEGRREGRVQASGTEGEGERG